MSTRPLNTLHLQNSVPSKVAEKYFFSPKFDIWNTRACGNCYFLAYQVFFQKHLFVSFFLLTYPLTGEVGLWRFQPPQLTSSENGCWFVNYTPFTWPKWRCYPLAPFYPFRSVNRTYTTRSEDYGKFCKAWNFLIRKCSSQWTITYFSWNHQKTIRFQIISEETEVN